MTIEQLRQQYEARLPILDKVAKSLELYLSNLLSEVTRIDRVNARAKTLDRYSNKACKIDASGGPKYQDPISDIQDQIGARIIVFYLPDVDRIKQHIEKYFRFIEVTEKHPASDAEFGYFGLHYVAKIPEDIIPDELVDDVPEFFELQIKTLFQHAWSEAHHDLGYKSSRSLEAGEIRRLSFTAAQAWGADTMFAEILQQLACTTIRRLVFLTPTTAPNTAR